MKFDPDKDYAKHRDAAGQVCYIQDGHLFTITGDHIGKQGKPVNDADLRVKRDKEAAMTVRERAAEKLKGFKENQATGKIADALRENQAAAAAEEANT